MIEEKKGAFKFVNFKVKNFTYNDINNKKGEISLYFQPSGIYNKSNNRFTLILLLKAIEKDSESVLIESKFEALFQLEEYSENVLKFFYKNALAIAFPYIRAFISTLTLQSNNGVLMLELMNLTHLEKPLVENTVIED